MNLEEYQRAVERTCATKDEQETLKMTMMGLQDELGEVAGPIKKYLWHGHHLDILHLEEEIGDVLWYLATLCNALNISLEAALEGNCEKLRQRYPHGFDPWRSIHREEQEEGGHMSE